MCEFPEGSKARRPSRRLAPDSPYTPVCPCPCASVNAWNAHGHAHSPRPHSPCPCPCAPGASWVPLGSSWVSLGASGGSLGFSGGSLGASWVLLGDPWEPCSAIFKFPPPRRAGQRPMESAAVLASAKLVRVLGWFITGSFKLLLNCLKKPF